MRNIIAAVGNSRTWCLDQVTFAQQWPNLILQAAGDIVTQATYIRHSNDTNYNNLLRGTNHYIYNLGGGGGTTAWMLSALPIDVCWFGPGLVMLTSLATNDINTGVSAETTQTNVRAIMDLLNDWGIRFVVTGDFYVNGWSTAQKDALDAYNIWEMAECEQRNIPHLSIVETLCDIDTRNIKTAYNYGDGIHLNAAGNAAIASAWYSTFSSYLTLGVGRQKGHVAAYNPVHHYVVHHDGLLWDHATGLNVAKHTGTATTLTVSDRQTGLRGLNALYPDSIRLQIPASRMNPDEGTIIIIHQNPTSLSTRAQFFWGGSAGGFVQLATTGGSYGNPTAWYRNTALTDFAVFGPNKVNTNEYAHAIRYKSGEGVRCYNDGVTGSASTNLIPMTAWNDCAFIGRTYSGLYGHGSGIYAVIVYDTALTAEQISEVSTIELLGNYCFTPQVTII